jgi:iron(III) transport system permease protein
VISWLGRLLYVAIVFGPVVALVAAALSVPLSGHPGAIGLMLPGVPWLVFARSVGLAVGVAAVCASVGTLVATALWRYRRGRAAQLRWLVLVLAPVPAYVHALAWSSAAVVVGRWLGSLGVPDIVLSGATKALWVEAMAMLPLSTALSLLALETVPRELVDAGRMHVSDIRLFRVIGLPLAGPLILAGAGVVFVLSLLDYSVPALFQVNVYSLAVFAEYSARNDPVRALLMALPLIVVAVAVMLASQGGLRRVAHRPERPRSESALRFAWPRWFVVAQAAACAVFALHIAVPLVALTSATGSLGVLGATLASSNREIWFSFAVALAAAVLCLPLAMAAARQLLRRDRVGRLWWLLVTVPLAIPAPLIGIGLIALWNRPHLPGVYGSAAMPVLASLARFTPFAAIIVMSQLRRIDPLLIDAARVLGGGGLRPWLRVRLPLLLPGLLAAACVAFALTLGELGATLLVAAPGDQTLTMRIYNYLHFGASDAVAGLCLAMALAAIAAGLLAMLVLTAWSRLSAVPFEATR